MIKLIFEYADKYNIILDIDSKDYIILSWATEIKKKKNNYNIVKLIINNAKRYNIKLRLIKNNIHKDCQFCLSLKIIILT